MGRNTQTEEIQSAYTRKAETIVQCNISLFSAKTCPEQPQQITLMPTDGRCIMVSFEVRLAVNWYSFHNRDGLVRRRMRFGRM